MKNEQQKAQVINNIEIHQTPESKSNAISFKIDFIDSIEAVEFLGMKLSDIFVWPNFYFTSSNEEGEVITGSFELFKESDTNLFIVRGTYLSGKSAISKKLFLEFKNIKNYYPLLVNGGNIQKGDIDFNKALEREFSTQYEGNFNEFKKLESKIIIVDDYNFLINKKFINYCKENFLKAVFTVSDDDYLLYFNDDENYVEFDTLSINTLSSVNQFELIEKWLKKTFDYTKEAIYTKNLDLIQSRVEDVIGKQQLVPSFPFYVLSIMQAFNNVSTQQYHMSSYGHCYHALIISQLDKKGINNTQINYCLNFLKHLAHYIFKIKGNNYSYITDKEYAEFRFEYSKEFSMMSKSTFNKLINSNYPILRNIDGNISFQYEYIYYYFIGKYIAESENSISYIEKLTESIHKKSSSNILIFTIHHATNTELLENIQIHCMYTFDQVEVNLLTPAETKFLHNIADVLPENITTNKSISEYRREKQKHKDTVNKNYKEMTDDEIDQSAELIELSRSFKIIEVLGQILKNRSGDLRKVKLEELLFEIEKLGLRLMTYLLDFINSEGFFDSIEKMLEIVEKTKGEKYFSKNEKRQTIENFVHNTGMRTVIGLLIKIYHSVGIEEILEYQRNITNKNPYPSYELIYLLFELNFSKFDQVKIRKTYNKFSDENNFVAMRAMSLFVQEYMNNHKVDQGIRQSIYEMLNIHYVPNKALLLNAK